MRRVLAYPVAQACLSVEGKRTAASAARGRRSGAAGTCLFVAALVLAGCGSTSEGPSSGGAAVGGASTPSSLPRERLIGRWGIASFHTEKDRKRTEAQAKGGCAQPYAISKGPSDGVMMHVADDPKPYELRLKGGPGGKTYLGFEAPAGDPQDREILSASDSMLTMRFVDPDANRRYGTFIYARCGA